MSTADYAYAQELALLSKDRGYPVPYGHYPFVTSDSYLGVTPESARPVRPTAGEISTSYKAAIENHFENVRHHVNAKQDLLQARINEIFAQSEVCGDGARQLCITPTQHTSLHTRFNPTAC